MSATARLLGWCVAFGLTLSVSSVSAGPNVMVGGTHVSWIALGQTDQGDSAASRRDAEKWLKQAREAMKNGNLDIAEYCIERAEKVSVKQGSLFSTFKDSPAKARRISMGCAEQGKPKGRQPDRCPSCSTRTRAAAPHVHRRIRTLARRWLARGPELLVDWRMPVLPVPVRWPTPGCHGYQPPGRPAKRTARHSGHLTRWATWVAAIARQGAATCFAMLVRRLPRVTLNEPRCSWNRPETWA